MEGGHLWSKVHHIDKSINTGSLWEGVEDSLSRFYLDFDPVTLIFGLLHSQLVLIYQSCRSLAPEVVAYVGSFWPLSDLK